MHTKNNWRGVKHLTTIPLEHGPILSKYYGYQYTQVDNCRKYNCRIDIHLWSVHYIKSSARETGARTSCIGTYST